MTESGRLSSGVKAEQPNDVWTVDFKGWWKDREGLRVEPLRVRDEHSRMLLEMRVPAEVYRPSARAYVGTPADLDYGGMQTRKVTRNTGEICYRNAGILISAALGGWSVGLSECENGFVEVWFSKLLVGHLDPTTASFKPAQLGGLKAGQTNPE